jgi:hypothetical protein
MYSCAFFMGSNDPSTDKEEDVLNREPLITLGLQKKRKRENQS